MKRFLGIAILPIVAVLASPTAEANPAIGDTVTYELFSDGALNKVNWVDAYGQVQGADPLSKSWSLTVVNKVPYTLGPTGRIANFYYLDASTYGTQLSCRLTVNGVVIDQDTQVVPDTMHGVFCCMKLPRGGCFDDGD